MLRGFVDGLVVVAVAVVVGAAIGAWWTENDWVQVAGMLVATAFTAVAIDHPSTRRSV